MPVGVNPGRGGDGGCFPVKLKTHPGAQRLHPLGAVTGDCQRCSSTYPRCDTSFVTAPNRNN